MKCVQKVYTCSKVLTDQDPVQFVSLPRDTAQVLVQVLIPEGDLANGKYVTTNPDSWFKLESTTNPLIVSSSMIPTDNSSVSNGKFTLSIGIVRSGLTG